MSLFTVPLAARKFDIRSFSTERRFRTRATRCGTRSCSDSPPRSAGVALQPERVEQVRRRAQERRVRNLKAWGRRDRRDRLMKATRVFRDRETTRQSSSRSRAEDDGTSRRRKKKERRKNVLFSRKKDTSRRASSSRRPPPRSHSLREPFEVRDAHAHLGRRRRRHRAPRAGGVGSVSAAAASARSLSPLAFSVRTPRGFTSSGASICASSSSVQSSNPCALTTARSSRSPNVASRRFRNPRRTATDAEGARNARNASRAAFFFSSSSWSWSAVSSLAAFRFRFRFRSRFRLAVVRVALASRASLPRRVPPGARAVTSSRRSRRVVVVRRVARDVRRKKNGAARARCLLSFSSSPLRVASNLLPVLVQLDDLGRLDARAHLFDTRVLLVLVLVLRSPGFGPGLGLGLGSGEIGVGSLLRARARRVRPRVALVRRPVTRVLSRRVRVRLHLARLRAAGSARGRGRGGRAGASAATRPVGGLVGSLSRLRRERGDGERGEHGAVLRQPLLAVHLVLREAIWHRVRHRIRARPAPRRHGGWTRAPRRGKCRTRRIGTRSALRVISEARRLTRDVSG